MVSSPQTLEFGFAEARGKLREQDPDRYFATLFAPKEHRPGLWALYAFNMEIARVRQMVSEPLPGEVRLQWWRDVIEGQRPSDGSAHPLAAAILATIETYRLPIKPFVDLIDARVFDLYDDLMPSWNDLEGYLGETSSSLISLASMVLGEGDPAQVADAAGHAGVAYGMCVMVRQLAWHAQHGQVFLPAEALKPYNLGREDLLRGRETEELKKVLSQLCDRAAGHLNAVRTAKGAITRDVFPAYLPLATIAPTLRQARDERWSPFRTAITIPDWQRIWCMWRWKL